MPRPKVSVIIPSYNQDMKLLGEAVTSALRQTVPTEVIVVDDGSDEGFAYLAPTRVIRHEENRGIAAALNAGIRSMRTDWFCWLSSDDLITPDKVQRQLEAIQASDCKASMHPYEVVDLDGRRLGYSQPPPRFMADMQKSSKPLEWWTWPSIVEQRQDFARNCWVNGSTCMIHRSVIEDVGMVDESYLYGQDWEWWVRIGQKYRWVFVNRLLGVRREGGNLTAKINGDESLRSVRDAEDRRIMKQASAGIYE